MLLTSLVCCLFLGSFSSAFNVILAIPMSLIGTFIFLYFFGFTLNTFTLLGLSLSIGIVVDDAIMVLENIVRHREMGKSRVQAALVGAREITFAAVAATLAILAIFLPVVFMKGIIGKFFFQFGVTITVAVLLSLLEALTLAPMRCSQFLHARQASNRVDALRRDAFMERARRAPTGAALDALPQLALDGARGRARGLRLVAARREGRCARSSCRRRTRAASSSRSTRRWARRSTFTDQVFQEAEKLICRSRPEVDGYYTRSAASGAASSTRASSSSR